MTIHPRFLSLPLLALALALNTVALAPAARAGDPLDKLRDKIFGDDDKKKDKDKDKKKKKKDHDHDHDHSYAKHDHYDRNHDGYCDVCGSSIVVVREPADVVERRPYVERRSEVYVEPAPRPYAQPRSLEADVQAALRRNGYYRGPVDGEIGASTRSAIRDYQYDQGLSATGRIDRSLLNSLGL